ncbi:MAG: DUF4364 family protein [Oscillospiraceae bacterium]|nr:DUF4364 family protein [Oscillospiraceae bacterium]
MMETNGYIRDKLDLKLLILFILRQLPAEIDSERLAELVLLDGGINYFDYKVCLSELVESAQVEETAEGCRVTAKGSRNCEALENNIPWSVRSRARQLLAPVADEMRRQALVLANHEAGEGGVNVYLSLSDGLGSIFDLRILAADEAQAGRIERSFRAGAEEIYHRFLQELSK